MPFDWQKQVEARGHGMVTDDILTWEEEGDELLVMGLRLREGIDPRRYAALADHPLDDARIAALRHEGFVESTGEGRLRVHVGLPGAGCRGGGSGGLMAGVADEDVFVIGGPNGAENDGGKSLTTEDLDLLEFLNADEIARGLSPFDPEANAIPAGQMMIERIDRLVGAGKSFAFETTCAGHRQAKLLRSCRAAGYRITFVYLWLPSAQMAISRVAQRVSRGGHHIPEDVIIRRYTAGIDNMRHMFLPLADIAADLRQFDRASCVDRRKGIELAIQGARRRAVEAHRGCSR